MYHFNILLAVVLVFCMSCKNQTKEALHDHTSPSIASSKSPSSEQISLDNYKAAQIKFNQNPDDLENIIWYGRRTAYLGKFKEAIKIYTDGLAKYPQSSRLLRHRGHRYISMRQYDDAIVDLKKASALIAHQENKTEQDGIPNKFNTPISTEHGNIWYHLGLAYYLIHDYPKAYMAYTNCKKIGGNDDNIVSSSHWLYMIQKRLEDKPENKNVLSEISNSMSVIENQSYYDLCKLYKGLVELEEIDPFKDADDNPSSYAVKYGVANWHFYNGRHEKAKELMKKIVDGDKSSAFGYLAAESDIEKYFVIVND